jgi:hypothetical protein
VIAGIAKYFLNDFLFYTSHFPNTRTFFIDFTFSSMCEALSSNPSIAKKKKPNKKIQRFSLLPANSPKNTVAFNQFS